MKSCSVCRSWQGNDVLYLYDIHRKNTVICTVILVFGLPKINYSINFIGSEFILKVSEINKLNKDIGEISCLAISSCGLYQRIST